jgi:DNA-binding NtrC family response regulator
MVPHAQAFRVPARLLVVSTGTPEHHAMTPSPAPLVLIVDDNVEMLDALSRLLAGVPDLEVRTEADPHVALRSLQSPARLPTVIVSDYKMPGMDGVAFLQQAARLAPRAKCILLTGTPDSFAVQAGRGGVADYIVLSKPIEADLFLKIVTRQAALGAGP